MASPQALAVDPKPESEPFLGAIELTILTYQLALPHPYKFVDRQDRASADENRLASTAFMFS